MSNVLFQDQSPVTQTINSGKALAQFLGLEEALPQVIPLANGARLSLSSKRDCYYFTNSRSCSCRAGQYGRDCKHKRALMQGALPSPVPSPQTTRRKEARISVAQSKVKAQAYQARQKQLRAQARETSSPIDEEPLFQKVPFKPFLEA